MNKVEIPNIVNQRLKSGSNIEWLMEFPQTLHRICSHEDLNFVYINPKSRSGISAHCLDENNNAFVVKLFPPLSSAFFNELNAQRCLEYSFLVRAIRTNIDECYFIFKEVRECKELNSPKLQDRLASTTNLFLTVEMEYRLNRGHILTDYWEKLTLRYQEIVNKYGWYSDLVVGYNQAISLYKSHFKDIPCFGLHGDLHHGNIMCESDRLVAIDPLGIFAPIYFEFTRYIENEIFNFSDYYEFRESYKAILEHFSQFVSNPYLLHCAVYIDSVFRTSSSVINKEGARIIDKGTLNAYMLWRYFEEF